MADLAMLNDMCLHDLFIPAGKHYLANAGFPLCASLMVLFWGVHHHLSEWGRGPFELSHYLLSLALRAYNHLGHSILRSFSIYWPTTWGKESLG